MKLFSDSKTEQLFLQPPNYVMDAQGEPQAILLDIATWQKILTLLENVIDQQILQQAQTDLYQLSQGKTVSGWQDWNEFETELDTLETADEL